jgi:hypothetical protein
MRLAKIYCVHVWLRVLPRYENVASLQVLVRAHMIALEASDVIIANERLARGGYSFVPVRISVVCRVENGLEIANASRDE